jgi:nitroreductase
MDLVTAIEQRRSVREFLDKEVDPEMVREIIRLGTLAPTACNRQGWRFIVVSDPEIRRKISERGGSKIIVKAPAGILVLYNKFTINVEYPDNVESASACIQNMLLAATSLGLGTCWINHLPPKACLRRIFAIPSRYDIVAYIALGYPGVVPRTVSRKCRSVDEILSYNRFEMQKEIETRQVNGLVMRLLLFCQKGPRFFRSVQHRIMRRLGMNDIFKVDHD